MTPAVSAARATVNVVAARVVTVAVVVFLKHVTSVGILDTSHEVSTYKVLTDVTGKPVVRVTEQIAEVSVLVDRCVVVVPPG